MCCTKVLKNSHISACTDVQTLDSTPSLITDENGLSSNGFIHSILTRRLGLIVGCCLGIIVFIVMISVLSYVKLKKQRIENAKRQAALPPEYISYRHFSIPNEELARTAAAGGSGGAAAGSGSASVSAAVSGATSSATHMSSVPSGISAHISGTSLSTGTGTGTTTTTATTPIGGVPLPMAKAGSPIAALGGGLVVEPVAAAGHSHHGHHGHQQQAAQQQQHRQNNGGIAGYMAAGVVLNTNHLSVC
ncbi:GL16460 [Drosophila persimilis]|uniref:GL16460 n=1 Tax=Drosophila persimilis TaxID=7234 RepID=B4GWE4_DROPE|nr:GL16460 [Drosophila persimilis]